ncbi:MAG: PAS domain-containing protein [Candidatus Bathyarchaeota archaeon]|nr:PAS domain-containing protein [Candidatus Bathyarchaeota archaeon]
MTISASNSELQPPKKQKATGRKAVCEISGKTTRLLALAEELAHVGSWEWDITQSRAVWSPEMFRIFGIKPRAVGLTLEEYMSFIHPDDLEEVSRRVQSSFGKVYPNQKDEIDYRIIRPDGSIRVLHSQRLIKEVTEDGKLKVIVGVDQDVTERKQAEEALRRSEERFRAVAEAADVMVYETDVKTGKIKPLRGIKELAGYGPDEIDFSIDWVLNRIHPNDVQHVVATLKAVEEDPKIDKYVLVYRFRHKNGNYITVKDTAKAVKDQSGKTVLFIGGVRDITQRVRDQEKIKQYSRHLEELVEERTKQLQEKERLAAIGQTAGMVGHDIRNPLQAIIGEIYIIRYELASMPKSQVSKSINESLDSIEQGISYINKIVADLQDYSRQLRPEMQSVDLANLIGNVFEAITIPQNIKLSFNIQPLPKVNLDPTFTRRALANLINNAIQAMPQGGRLEISACQVENSINISITDTGGGIPDDVKAKLFTPMFTTKAKGQGLGLAVVKRLIEAQGGSISFETTVGKGTTFTIKLPL